MDDVIYRRPQNGKEFETYSVLIKVGSLTQEYKNSSRKRRFTFTTIAVNCKFEIASLKDIIEMSKWKLLMIITTWHNSYPEACASFLIT